MYHMSYLRQVPISYVTPSKLITLSSSVSFISFLSSFFYTSVFLFFSSVSSTTKGSLSSDISSIFCSFVLLFIFFLLTHTHTLRHLSLNFAYPHSLSKRCSNNVFHYHHTTIIIHHTGRSAGERSSRLAGL
ncbi:hypothetical protein B0H63DRAFT_274888 [Podospora didyma]|uniref:Uncharacterized protein n=1 Tax=Podospora didyma TaxID=330526 RepID=A0AAE0N936_9PEZI|nr:hypothetical protein B0H63DRAFT_274888 [Podospora didyma]